MDDLKIVTGKKKESVVDNASGFAFRHEYHISKGSTKGNKTVQDRMKLLLDAANDDATALAKLRKGGVDESLINKLKKATTTKNKFDILQKDTVISHFKEIMTSSTAREIRSRSMKTAQDYSRQRSSLAKTTKTASSNSTSPLRTGIRRVSLATRCTRTPETDSSARLLERFTSS